MGLNQECYAEKDGERIKLAEWWSFRELKDYFYPLINEQTKHIDAMIYGDDPHNGYELELTEDVLKNLLYDVLEGRKFDRVAEYQIEGLMNLVFDGRLYYSDGYKVIYTQSW